MTPPSAGMTLTLRLERAGPQRLNGQATATFSPRIPLGESRWLTVVSPDDPDGVELLLEPDNHPAAKSFKAALVEDGIPFTSFAVDDVRREFERLSGLGVRFTQEPTDMGPVTTAVLDDTCGNLIQIARQE